MKEENPVQVTENDTETRFKLGGFEQILLTLFIGWLFFTATLKYTDFIQPRATKYSIHTNGIWLYRINEATGVADRYDTDANGWVRIQDSGLVYIIDESSAQ